MRDIEEGAGGGGVSGRVRETERGSEEERERENTQTCGTRKRNRGERRGDEVGHKDEKKGCFSHQLKVQSFSFVCVCCFFLNDSLCTSSFRATSLTPCQH